MRDCYICHHAYPALKVCSRCGPQCATCHQAHDAARYRWLRERMACGSEQGDGILRWSLPQRALPRAHSVDEAVDMAMRQGDETCL